MTLLAYDPVFLEHDTGAHPECAQRLQAIAAEFERRGLFDRCQALKSKAITEAALLQVHTADQIRIAKEASSRGGGQIEADTVLSARSFHVALRSAGACIAAVDAVIAGKAATSLSIVRPPGHHATPNRSMGFCLFNNVALAAEHARSKHGLNRVLVIDWDVHHGNGTQDVFYSDPNVCFVSFHRYGGGFYPGTGSADETGAGDGLGYNVNIALSAGIARIVFVEQFRTVIEATADWFRPELVIISAGFDGHRLDPIGNLGLETEDYVALTEIALDIAKTHSNGRVVSCLEGGYHWQATAESVAAHLETLLAHDVAR